MDVSSPRFKNPSLLLTYNYLCSFFVILEELASKFSRLFQFSEKSVAALYVYVYLNFEDPHLLILLESAEAVDETTTSYFRSHYVFSSKISASVSTVMKEAAICLG